LLILAAVSVFLVGEAPDSFCAGKKGKISSYEADVFISESLRSYRAIIYDFAVCCLMFMADFLY